MDHNILNSPVPEFALRSSRVVRPVVRSLSTRPLALRSLRVGGKSYSQARKIVNLIDTPELEHVATHSKQRKGVSSNRQQMRVFAGSYQIVYFRIPMNSPPSLA